MYVIPTYKNIMIGVENSEEGQIVDYDQMIRIIYLQQLNAQIDIIYLHSQKLLSRVLFWALFGGLSVHHNLPRFSQMHMSSQITCLKRCKVI